MTKSNKYFVLKTCLFTCLALLAFAANSVICRLALGEASIDASGFTIVRLLSGVVTLLCILVIKNEKTSSKSSGSWLSGFMLFIYACGFSFAYVLLDTASGALILFGSVQITMLLISVLKGEKLSVYEWLGVLIAFFGFVYLILPDIASPSLSGFILMSLAGIAWGIYTLKGRASLNPFMDTAFNFFRTIPFVIILILVSMQNFNFTSQGILLALLSGSIASAVGYTIWYYALTGLSSTQAAVLQLLVPIIAAIGGVIFVGEIITTRLVIASALIIGGIFLVVMSKGYLLKKT